MDYYRQALIDEATESIKRKCVLPFRSVWTRANSTQILQGAMEDNDLAVLPEHWRKGSVLCYTLGAKLTKLQIWFSSHRCS